MAQVVNKLEFNMVVQDKQEVVLDEKKDKKKEENLEAHPNADGDGPPLTKKLKLDNLPSSSLDSPSKQVSEILRTPGKIRTADVPVTPDQNQLAQDEQLAQDDKLAQDNPLAEDVEHLAPMIKVQFSKGTVNNVDFLGLDGQTAWNWNDLREYFFLVLGHQIVQVRAATDCSLDILLNHMLSKFDILLLDPQITFEGKARDLVDNLFQFPEKSLFIITDGTLPDHLLSHSGRLWQCLDCGKAVTTKPHLSKTKGRCPGQHRNILFNDLLKPTLGTKIDRHSLPWACPEGHGGAEPLVQLHEVQHANVPLVVQQTPKAPR